MVFRELSRLSSQEWLSLSTPETLLDVVSGAAPKVILAPLSVSGLAASASSGFDMAAIRPARELPAFTANERSPLARSRSWDAAISAALHLAALAALLTWATPVTETASPEPVTIEIVADTPAPPVRESEVAPAPPTSPLVEPPPVAEPSPPPVAESPPPPPVVEPSPTPVAEAPPPPPVVEPSPPPVAEAPPPPPVVEPSPPPVAEAPPPPPVAEPSPPVAEAPPPPPVAEPSPLRSRKRPRRRPSSNPLPLRSRKRPRRRPSSNPLPLRSRKRPRRRRRRTLSSSGRGSAATQAGRRADAAARAPGEFRAAARPEADADRGESCHGASRETAALREAHSAEGREADATRKDEPEDFT